MKYRMVILAVVVLLVALVLAKPHLPFLRSRVAEEFTPTPQPYRAYREALIAEKPAFLELYARW